MLRVLRAICKYPLGFLVSLVLLPVRGICWVVCQFAILGILIVVLVGSLGVGIAAGFHAAAWFPVWGDVLTGFLVADILYCIVWCVNPVAMAWMGVLEWLAEVMTVMEG